MSASTIPASGMPELGLRPHSVTGVMRRAGSRATGAMLSAYEELSAVEVADGPWRLTARGRAVVLVLCAVLLAGATAVGFASGGAQASAASTSAGHVSGVTAAAPVAVPVAATAPLQREVVVRPGDTLWDVARRARPDADPREALEQLRQVNTLQGAEVVPGQRLRLPTGW